ncbi:hypothetical protein I316_05201 [Kwoniella heveanensis BCC8398]|uniref:DNA/RNA-binding domain-containing protein n=1 Tax=Kwoniella heveanensis BCC8398 TaxID=1296120 RepID=A0A1B9GQ74_9TREE|nr:hypothetical protein I316_05201 [Kwoniella heveanensis BCC8398]
MSSAVSLSRLPVSAPYPELSIAESDPDAALAYGCKLTRWDSIHRSYPSCRDLHLVILFAHSLSPYAQSLDQIWHHTTYLLIAAYRDLLANIERTLSLPGSQPSSGSRTRRGGGGERGGGGSGKDERSQIASDLKKAATRFRQALSTEETFYRSLIGRIVNHHDLAQVDDTASYLAEAKIPLGDSNDEDDERANGKLETDQEKRDKLALVYKGLICLGDLERYKEQYKEPSKSRRGRSNQGPSGGRTVEEEKFGAAKRYYEIARGLQPDDGAAFNQLAVISTYQSNDFCTTYYYFRALAIRNAFKGADGILYKFFGKVFERWRARQKEDRLKEGNESGEDGEVVQGKDEVQVWKGELVVLVGILYLKAGFTFLPTLQPPVLETFSMLLKARRLSAEVVVKTTAVAIGSHYRARSTMGLEQPPKQIQRSLEAETKALEFLLNTFEVLMRVGAEEVEEARSTLGDESALALDGEDGNEDQLPQFISAVLRRILPSLRIVSKWIKLDLEYLNRHTSLPAFTSFWATYRRFIDAVESVFPIDRLPSLPNPLEEDIDMRGFMPLQRGITTHGGPTNGHSTATGDPEGTGVHGDVHPNEEQLMRLADLQVDAKLITQRRSGSNLGGGPDVLALPSSTIGVAENGMVRDEDQADLASVSTETEDDPVNLAMRATLGAGSSIDVEEDRDAEMSWNQRPQAAISAPSTDHPLLHHPEFATATPSLPSTKKPTAYDLLQNLMLESTPTPPAQHPSFANLPTGNPSSSPGPTSTSSPHAAPGSGHPPPAPGAGATAGPTGGNALLFGAPPSGSSSLGPSSGSIWTMTREESEKGQKRASAGNLASIWGNPPPSGEATSVPSLFAATSMNLTHTSTTTHNNPSVPMPTAAPYAHATDINQGYSPVGYPTYGAAPAHATVPPLSQYASPHQSQTQPRTQHPHLNSTLWDFSTAPLSSSSSPSAFPPTSPAYPYDSIQGQIPYYAQPTYLSKFSQPGAGITPKAESPGTGYGSPHGYAGYGYEGAWTTSGSGSGATGGQGSDNQAGYGRPP